MTENHTSDYLRESGTDTLERNLMIRTPKMAALTAAMYDQFSKIIEPDIRSEYEERLKKKDAEIERYKQLLEQQQTLINELGYTQSKAKKVKEEIQEDDIKLTAPVNCDYSLFPDHNQEEVVKVIIEAVQAKREKDKFLIGTKSDLFIVWKILRYYGIFTGYSADFIIFFNECVIPNLTDEERKKRLSLDKSNFTTIDNTSFIKKFRVNEWCQEHEKQRAKEETEKQKIRHGETILKRAVVILSRLEQILEKRNIPFTHAEKRRY